MITWGISANSHDAALAVFTDEGLEFASHSERFSGIKNDPDLNKELIDYAKKWGQPDELIWYERPLVKTLRQFRAGQGIRLRENNIRNYLRSYGLHAPVRFVSHHHSHAAAGYYTSSFSEACVIVIDSIGEFAASDRSRMLPVIDLVNHGSLELANVQVGHFSHEDDDSNDLLIVIFKQRFF